MSINVFTTPLQGSNICNDVADFCLAPLRLLAGEQRGYYVIKAESGAVANVLIDEQALRVDSYVQKAFVFLLGVLVVPVVFGAVFKCVALLCGSYDDYQAVAQLKPGLYATSNGLPLVPTIVNPEIAEDIDLNCYDLSALVPIWDQVGKGRPNYWHERAVLQRWIQRVPDPSNYWRLQNWDLQKINAENVTCTVKRIIHQFGKPHVTQNKKEKIIATFIEKANDCAGTWDEMARGIYMDLCTGGFHDYFLRLVQKFKEGNILEYVQIQQNIISWHKINVFRYVHGNAFGLVTEGLEFDPNYQIDPCDWFDPTLVRVVLEPYQVDRIATSLEAAMHEDVEHHDDVVASLAAAVKRGRPDIEDADVDAYVKATYFYPFKGDLTKTEQYLAFAEQMAQNQARIKDLAQELREDDGLDEVEAILSSLDQDEQWRGIVASQKALSDEAAALNPAGKPQMEQVKILRAKTALMRQISDLEQKLTDLIDTEAWIAAVKRRSQLIADRTKKQNQFRLAQADLAELPARRDEAMTGLELDQRRQINRAGVEVLLLEFGLATQVN